MGIVGRHDALVGGEQHAGGGIARGRQLVERDIRPPSALAVVRQPTVPCGAHRHAAGGEKGDGTSAVGHNKTLHGTVKVTQSAPHVIDGTGTGERETGLDSGVVAVEYGPAQRYRLTGSDDIGMLGAYVGDNGAVGGLAHDNGPTVIAETYRFLAHPYHVVLVDHEQVLHVGAGVGDAPGGISVAPNHNHGNAGNGGTDDVESRRRKMGQIPGGRRGQPEMGVVGEDRLSVRRTPPGDDPVVGADIGRWRWWQGGKSPFEHTVIEGG